MAASWDFILCDSSGNALAELSTASGRTIAFKRNSYTEVSLTLSHEDDAAALFLSALGTTGVPKLKGYRRGANDAPSTPAALRFRGYAAALSEQSDETSLLTATFRSPYGVLVGDGDKSGRFLTSAFPTVYNAMDAGAIAKALIDLTNTDSPTGLATDPSLIAATTVRNATYPVGQQVGSAITNLSALLDGFDFFETFAETGTVTTTPLPAAPISLSLSSPAGPAWPQPSGTYFWVVTAMVGGVETQPSNEVSIALTNGTSNCPVLAFSSVAGATAYKVYRATSSSGEANSPALATTLASPVSTWADLGAATTAGAVAFPANPSWLVDSFFNVTPSLGVVNPSARFEYGPRTLANVQHMDRTTTPPLNTLFVTGGNGLTSTFSSDVSVARYGKWWGHYDFPDIIDQATLDAKARALCRPNPVKTVAIIPELGLENCPKPFDDWNLGDTVTFFASRGALSENTQMRINGFTIPIDENGFETVSVDDPTSPEEDAVTMAQLTAEVDVTS